MVLPTIHEQEVLTKAEVGLPALAVRCRPGAQFLSHLKHNVEFCGRLSRIGVTTGTHPGPPGGIVSKLAC